MLVYQRVPIDGDFPVRKLLVYGYGYHPTRIGSSARRADLRSRCWEGGKAMAFLKFETYQF